MLKILVVRLSSIGDIVHTLPAVAALGQALPDAGIDWVVESRYAELLEDNPFINRVIALDTLGWRRRWHSFGAWRAAARSLEEIRSLRPDIAIDFQGLIKSAAVARLSGAAKRIGFGGRWLREAMAGRLYTEQASAADSRHVVEENLALVQCLGVRPVDRERWRFPLPRSAAAEDRVTKRLAALGAREFVVINPGGGWTSKRWAPAQYAALVRELAGRLEYDVLVTGSPAEEAMIGAILKESQPARSFYFPSTLMEFIVLMRRARLFVGGDTGPLHLAAAAGTPIVAIYGPTSPARNGPFAADDITVWNEDLSGANRGYAHWGGGRGNRQTYLGGVSVEKVLDAVSRRLAGGYGA
ncbi:MAG TPA: lipopolysaccharide heptosyltransferase I [Terriglobia bacterium]|nr:lipopolysaccharide heptosyltransferase I [Terriglobia bacterium]